MLLSIDGGAPRTFDNSTSSGLAPNLARGPHNATVTTAGAGSFLFQSATFLVDSGIPGCAATGASARLMRAARRS